MLEAALDRRLFFVRSQRVGRRSSAGYRAVAADAALATGEAFVSGPFWPQPPIRPQQASRTSSRLAQDAAGVATLESNFIAGILSTMTSATPPAASLSDADFHRLSQAVLTAIETTVDGWLDADVIDIDSQRTGGLLELSLPGGSKIVINTQPPLHELWLAARAGGHHYRWVEGRWLDTRDGSEFFDALSRHASAQTGTNLVFVAP
jgi:CyaY protein